MVSCLQEMTELGQGAGVSEPTIPTKPTPIPPTLIRAYFVYIYIDLKIYIFLCTHCVLVKYFLDTLTACGFNDRKTCPVERRWKSSARSCFLGPFQKVEAFSWKGNFGYS